METHATDTAPTNLDHRLAELRGIYLCEMCGAELRYPANPQICGRCEEKQEEAA